MKRTFFAVLTVLVFILLGANQAQACKCASPGGGAICQDYTRTPAVFSGKVVQIDNIESKPGGLTLFSKRIKFAVIDSYRGVTGQTVEIMGGGPCSYTFELSESYLVFAGGSQGNLSTSTCTRTKKLAEAGADLEHIRGLADAPHGASLTGEVLRHSPAEKSGEYKPVPGSEVSVENMEGISQSTVTDDSGKFSFARLPAGRYKIRAPAPPGYTIRYRSLYMELVDKGCGYERFVFEAKRH